MERPTGRAHTGKGQGFHEHAGVLPYPFILDWSRGRGHRSHHRRHGLMLTKKQSDAERKEERRSPPHDLGGTQQWPQQVLVFVVSVLVLSTLLSVMVLVVVFSRVEKQSRGGRNKRRVALAHALSVLVTCFLPCVQRAMSVLSYNIQSFTHLLPQPKLLATTPPAALAPLACGSTKCRQKSVWIGPPSSCHTAA